MLVGQQWGANTLVAKQKKGKKWSQMIHKNYQILYSLQTYRCIYTSLKKGNVLWSLDFWFCPDEHLRNACTYIDSSISVHRMKGNSGGPKSVNFQGKWSCSGFIKSRLEQLHRRWLQILSGQLVQPHVLNHLEPMFIYSLLIRYWSIIPSWQRNPVTFIIGICIILLGCFYRGYLTPCDINWRN